MRSGQTRGARALRRRGCAWELLRARCGRRFESGEVTADAVRGQDWPSGNESPHGVDSRLRGSAAGSDLCSRASDERAPRRRPRRAAPVPQVGGWQAGARPSPRRRLSTGGRALFRALPWRRQRAAGAGSRARRGRRPQRLADRRLGADPRRPRRRARGAAAAAQHPRGLLAPARARPASRVARPPRRALRVPQQDGVPRPVPGQPRGTFQHAVGRLRAALRRPRQPARALPRAARRQLPPRRLRTRSGGHHGRRLRLPRPAVLAAGRLRRLRPLHPRPVPGRGSRAAGGLRAPARRGGRAFRVDQLRHGRGARALPRLPADSHRGPPRDQPHGLPARDPGIADPELPGVSRGPAGRRTPSARRPARGAR